MREDRYSTAESNIDSEQGEMAQRRAILLRLLRGRWHWAILLALLLSVAGSYLGYNSQPNKFEATAPIKILANYDAESPADVVDLSVNQNYLNFVKGETARIKSRDIALAAMALPEWTQAAGQRPGHLPEITAENFTDHIAVTEPGKNEETIYVSFINEDPDTARAGLNSLFRAYADLRKEIEEEDFGGNLDDLIYSSQQLKGEIVDVKKSIEKQLNEGENPQSLRSSYTARLGELANLQFMLKELLVQLKPYESNETSEDGAEPKAEDPTAKAARLKALLLQDEQMSALLAEQKRLNELYEYLVNVRKRGENMPDVMQVRADQLWINRRVSTYEDQWYKEAADGSPATTSTAVADLRNQQRVLGDMITQISKEIADMGPRVEKLDEYEVKLAKVVALRDGVEDNIRRFRSSEALKNRNENDLSRIKIGDKVLTPSTPYNAGKRRQLAGVGAIGGMFMGFGLVMAVGLLDRRLRHVSDTAVDMPDANVLGILPTLPAKLTDPEDAETAAHCVHHIRALLQIGGSNRVFSITSPAAGSGKSSLATALGMSFATSGARTLVIDCDLVGAGLSRRMGSVVHESLDVVIRRNEMIGDADLASAQTKATASKKPLEQVLLDENLMSQELLERAIRLQRDTSLGLLDACRPSRLRPPVAKAGNDDLLIMFDDEQHRSHGQELMQGNASISYADASGDNERLLACVSGTDIENLSILSVGKARPADAGRLSPAAMRELLRQARESFDIVLVDTGPVLGSIEASIVSAEADATVLIVSRGDQKSLATKAIEQLRSVRANIAGIVFNHALERDITHTAYASVISQERRPNRSARKQRLDQTRSARLGPLGTAVASFADEDSSPKASQNGHDSDHD